MWSLICRASALQMCAIALSVFNNYITFFAVLSVVGRIQVYEGGSKVFIVICTSTGGRPLTMSVTGPSGVVEDMMNIVVEGNIEGMGNDTFSAEVVRHNGKHGDFYTCIASNGVSNISSNSPILQGLTFYYWHIKQAIIMCWFYSCLQSGFTPSNPDISYISDSGVESAIRRSHSDWICSTLQ